jgi:hypothetical protein
VAVYTDQGTCAGYGVWAGDGSDLMLAAAGPNAIETAQGGFASGESIKLEVYDASQNTRVDLGSDITYKSCNAVSLPLCQDDGAYGNGRVFIVSTFSSDPLPVELTSFKARRAASRATLTWTTASETNNAGFRVQHRRASTPSDASSSDPAGWTTLGFTEGAGTTSKAQSYRYRTDELPLGTHEFRLQQVDRGGTTSQSRVVSVEFTLDKAFALSGIYPNPLRATGALDLTVRRSQRVAVTVFDALGRRVKRLLNEKVAANQTRTLRFEARRLASGTYFVRVRGEQFVETRRFTVVQ